MPLKRPRALLERFLPAPLVQYVACFLPVRAALDFFMQVLRRSVLVPWPRLDGASTVQILFSQLPSLYRTVQRLAVLPRLQVFEAIVTARSFDVVNEILPLATSLLSLSIRASDPELRLARLRVPTSVAELKVDMDTTADQDDLAELLSRLSLTKLGLKVRRARLLDTTLRTVSKQLRVLELDAILDPVTLDMMPRCFPDLKELTMDAHTLDTRALAELRTLEGLRLTVDRLSQLAFVRELANLSTLEIMVEGKDYCCRVLVLPPGLKNFVCNSLNHVDRVEVHALLEPCLESLTLSAALLTSCPAKWIEGLRSLTCTVSVGLQQVVGGLRQLRHLHLISLSSRKARLDDIASSSVTSLVLQDFPSLPDSSWLRGFPTLGELDLRRCDEEAARSWISADTFQICTGLTRVVMPTWSTLIITVCKAPDGRIVKRIDGRIVSVL